MWLILVLLINNILALQEELNSQTVIGSVLCSVLVVHKKYIQDWSNYIRNIKTLWLVTVPKNVANFGLI